MLKNHQQQAQRRITFRYYCRREYARDAVCPKPITLLEVPRRDWDFFRLCFFPEVTGSIALIGAAPPVNLLLYARCRVDPHGSLILHRGRFPGRQKRTKRRHDAPAVVAHLAGRIRDLLAAAAAAAAESN
jgi:hypothetical protein